MARLRNPSRIGWPGWRRAIRRSCSRAWNIRAWPFAFSLPTCFGRSSERRLTWIRGATQPRVKKPSLNGVPGWPPKNLTPEKLLDHLRHALDLRVGHFRINREAEAFARGLFCDRKHARLVAER